MPILYSRDLPLRGFSRPVSPRCTFQTKIPFSFSQRHSRECHVFLCLVKVQYCLSLSLSSLICRYKICRRTAFEISNCHSLCQRLCLSLDCNSLQFLTNRENNEPYDFYPEHFPGKRNFLGREKFSFLRNFCTTEKILCGFGCLSEKIKIFSLFF